MRTWSLHCCRLSNARQTQMHYETREPATVICSACAVGWNVLSPPCGAICDGNACICTQEGLQRIVEAEEAKPQLQTDAQSLVATAAQGAVAEHAVVKRAEELTRARNDLLVNIATCAALWLTAASIMYWLCFGAVSL